MVNVALCALLIGLAQTPTVLAQRQPNFAGTWILQNTAGNETVAQRLRVEQPVTRWLARSPAYLTLAVEYHFPNRPVAIAHYELEAQGTAEVDSGAGATRTHFVHRWSHRWQGQVLHIESYSLPGEFNSSGGFLSERVETWRLDRRGRLVIDHRITDAGRLIVRKLYYQRETN
jgi:hypothetical protein